MTSNFVPILLGHLQVVVQLLKSDYPNYLMTGVPIGDDWRCFTQLIYDKSDTLAGSPVQLIVKLTAYNVWLLKEDTSQVAAMC